MKDQAIRFIAILLANLLILSPFIVGIATKSFLWGFFTAVFMWSLLAFIIGE